MNIVSYCVMQEFQRELREYSEWIADEREVIDGLAELRHEYPYRTFVLVARFDE